jgi:hypothetical protein
MSKLPWHSEPIYWRESGYGGNPAGKFPEHGEYVLAMDYYGAMAVCQYDAGSNDFLLSTKGFDSKEVIGLAVSIAREAVANVFKNRCKDFSLDDDLALYEISEQLVEESASNREGREPAYFSDVAAWMQLPPAHPMAYSSIMNDEEVSEKVELKTIDIMTALEPALRRIVYDVMMQDS